MGTASCGREIVWEGRVCGKRDSVGRESVWKGEDLNWRGCGKAGSEEGSFDDVRKKVWKGSV